jgi:uncharacterized membrane protein
MPEDIAAAVSTGAPSSTVFGAVTPQTNPPTEAGNAFDKWLEHFYKECGREVTLAYTTLNQMKNWAVLIVAAVISAVVSLNKTSTSVSQPSHGSELAIYAGSLIVYVFVLRFFVRAILCYINLVRWNNLQAAIVAFKLIQPTPRDGASLKSSDELKTELLTKIQDLYHAWRAPSRLTRNVQLVSNLKLGFALLLALPMFFAIMTGSHILASSSIARGLTVFAVGYTFVELVDFLRGGSFDTPEVHSARRRNSDREIFPTPVSDKEYLFYWLATILVSVIVGFWPQIIDTLRQLI